jgi:hypothetical protein
MVRAVRLLLALCALLPATSALADGWTVGVIVTATGPYADVGRAAGLRGRADGGGAREERRVR